MSVEPFDPNTISYVRLFPWVRLFRAPGLAFDSKGRLFVADRSNNRIQILDAETFKTLDTWYQFSRLSGIFIDRNDMLYGADSESGCSSRPCACRAGSRP